MNLGKTLTRSPLQLFRGVVSIGRYGLIGITGVTLDILFYVLLIRIEILPVIANMFRASLGITNNFIWNSFLNFKTRLSSIRGIKFATVGLFGLATPTTLISVFLLLGFTSITAKCLPVPLVVGAQYLVNRVWTFGK